jgi:hypothetical protein
VYRVLARPTTTGDTARHAYGLIDALIAGLRP